jgi:hypothetical protein
VPTQVQPTRTQKPTRAEQRRAVERALLRYMVALLSEIKRGWPMVRKLQVSAAPAKALGRSRARLGRARCKWALATERIACGPP